jgi:SAM-dependent methyltransferase
MPALHEDRQLAESFGAAAELYDRHRPSYPAELIDWLAPEPGTAVDVGCGTGRVGELLRARGWDVSCVEPDRRMAALARGKGLAVDVSTFEEWVPRVRDVDLVCSGQAWHWVDPSIGYRKAAEVLHPGGRFAAFWNLYAYEPPVQTTLAEVYGRYYPPSLLEDTVFVGTANRRADERDLVHLRSSGWFEQPGVRWFRHRREQALDDWLAELPTHSLHNRLDAEQTSRLLDELSDALLAETSGTVAVTYETLVVTGLRRSDAGAMGAG